MYTVFPFYTNLSYQYRNRAHCQGSGIFELVTMPNRFPPFLIKRPISDGLIDCIAIFKSDGTLYKRVKTTDVAYQLLFDTFHDYILYFGASLTDLNMPCGLYYLEVDGWYSELFTVRTNLDGYLRVQWSHEDNIDDLIYKTGWAQYIYLNTYLVEPEYEATSEQKKDGFGNNIPIYQRLEINRKIESLPVPEFVVSALQTIFLHSFVTVTDITGEVYAMVRNVTVKSDWMGTGCMGNVTITFTDAIAQSRVCSAEIQLQERSRAGEFYQAWKCEGGADPNPQWAFVTSSIKCEQEDAATRTNINRVAQMIDENSISPTFNQLRDGGAFFFYDTNAIACPLPVIEEPEPDPVFFNTQYSRQSNLQKDNCAFGFTGFGWLILVEAGRFSGTTQAEADAKAVALADSYDTQQNANLNGYCQPSPPEG